MSGHFYGSMTLLSYIDKFKSKKAIMALLHIHQETLCSTTNQDKAGSRQDKVWCRPLPSLLWMSSPLVFGQNVSSVHHWHTRPAQLLRGHICVKLSHHRAVIWCHTAPRPVVWDPGVGQALPHYHAVACSRKDTRKWEVSGHVGRHATYTQYQRVPRSTLIWQKLLWLTSNGHEPVAPPHVAANSPATCGGKLLPRLPEQ